MIWHWTEQITKSWHVKGARGVLFGDLGMHIEMPISWSLSNIHIVIYYIDWSGISYVGGGGWGWGLAVTLLCESVGMRRGFALHFEQLDTCRRHFWHKLDQSLLSYSDHLPTTSLKHEMILKLKIHRQYSAHWYNIGIGKNAEYWSFIALISGNPKSNCWLPLIYSHDADQWG